MTPHYADDWLTVYLGDVRTVLAELPAESVHCVVSSPPYWGLRDYGTASWEGGDAECDHAPDKRGSRFATPASEKQRSNTGSGTASRRDCPCGARRIDSQLGLEPTPEEYVAAMVGVFREVRRVLRRDGTLWLNMGDSYAASPPGNVTKGVSASSTLHGVNGQSGRYRETLAAGHATKRNTVVGNLKPKDLIGMPWRLAFALQADGWYLRSEITWCKPNPMPESVTDRPTSATEKVFLLARSERYFYDAEAVREPHLPSSLNRYSYAPSSYATEHADVNVKGRRPANGVDHNPAGRNLRNWWVIPSEPYPGAHFATFPRKLVEPCIRAGTSERGVCPECGAPWAREARASYDTEGRTTNGPRSMENRDITAGFAVRAVKTVQTTGWRPTCRHEAEPVPAVVLDPFAGSGTLAVVAESLGRRSVMVELKPDYVAQLMERVAAARREGIGAPADLPLPVPAGSLWETA